MEVTRVILRPLSMNKVRALATIVIDDQLAIHDLRVVDGDGGVFVAMPSRKLPNGEFRDICHATNNEGRAKIQRAVLAKIEALGGIEALDAAVGSSLE